MQYTFSKCTVFSATMGPSIKKTPKTNNVSSVG